MNCVNLTQVGKRISRRRKQLGITQEQLAEQINVSVQMISNLERGNKAVKIDNLVKLCEVLKVSTDYVLTGNQTAADMTPLLSKISGLAADDYRLVELLVERLTK